MEGFKNGNMSSVIERFLICDGCNDNIGVDNRHRTIKQQRLAAKKEGWIYYKGKDYCDVCSNIKSVVKDQSTTQQ